MKYDYIAILDSTLEELDHICKGDKNMEEYKDNIKRLNEDSEFTEWISREEDVRKVTNTLIDNAKEEGEKIGIKKGEEIGIKKGTEEKSKEIAKKLINKNFSKEEVSDITGLSIDEINNIKMN